MTLSLVSCGSASRGEDRKDVEETPYSSEQTKGSEEVLDTVSAAESDTEAMEITSEPVDTELTATEAETAFYEYKNGEEIYLDPSWKFSDYSVINSGCAVMYKAVGVRKNITVGVNAGHGTEGGTSQKTYCHPDMTPKVTGGSTKAGSITAVCVSSGMAFNDGTEEKSVNLRTAQLLRDKLLENGYDVLMIRDGEDVQLDNIARTVICNNAADCHISLHWDGDDLDYDKGVFYISVPDGIKYLDNVADTWEEDERLGESLVSALADGGYDLFNGGSLDIDLTQSSYTTIPSVDVELGNQCSDHSDENLARIASLLAAGIDDYFIKNNDR